MQNPNAPKNESDPLTSPHFHGRTRYRFLRCRGRTLATGARVDEASWKPCCTEPRAVAPRYGDLGASEAALLGACRGKDTVGTSEPVFRQVRRARVAVLVDAKDIGFCDAEA